jgi:hypothetical protein
MRHNARVAIANSRDGFGRRAQLPLASASAPPSSSSNPPEAAHMAVGDDRLSPAI